jgi:uptake hydrogenase large subunit
LNTNESGPGMSISSVQIQSSRNLATAQFLQGKPVTEAQKLLPVIYSLCSTAHGCASVEAYEQAQQKQAAESLVQARHALVEMETAREHLLHILLHWSTFLDTVITNGIPTLFKQLRGHSAQLFVSGDQTKTREQLQSFLNTDWERDLVKLEQCLSTDVLGMSLDEWLSIRHYADLMTWLDDHRTLAARMLKQVIKADWSNQCQSDTAALDDINDERLKEILDSERSQEFLARPDWQGECRESTSLTRCEQTPLLRDLRPVFGNGILTRVASRLTELVLLPGRIRDRLEKINSEPEGSNSNDSFADCGHGLAWVEAARGRLMHRMEIDKGMLKSYQILSPTEWNFHPDGVVAAGLHHLRSDDENQLNRLAGLYVDCIDPCVGYELQVNRGA